MDRQRINDLLAEAAMQWDTNDKYNYFGVITKAWFEQGKYIMLHDEWSPTTDLKQAWSVITAMLDYVNGPDRAVISAGKGIFGCIFQTFVGLGTSTGGFTIDEPTVEMAICLATLHELGLATGDENGKETT